MKLIYSYIRKGIEETLASNEQYNIIEDIKDINHAIKTMRDLERNLPEYSFELVVNEFETKITVRRK